MERVTSVLPWLLWLVGLVGAAAWGKRLMFDGSSFAEKVVWLASYATLLEIAVALLVTRSGWPAKTASALAIAVALGGGAMMVKMAGSANLLGMLQYDQRRAGTYQVGDAAPDVTLLELDGKRSVRLASRFGARPTVLIFGSFT